MKTIICSVPAQHEDESSMISLPRGYLYARLQLWPYLLPLNWLSWPSFATMKAHSRHLSLTFSDQSRSGFRILVATGLKTPFHFFFVCWIQTFTTRSHHSLPNKHPAFPQVCSLLF
jgi:hypothetical protein